MSDQSSVVALRRLLALSRDLLQAPDLRSVVSLVGPALQELLRTDEAVLLAAFGEQEYQTAFDQRGSLQPVDASASAHAAAHRALDEKAPIVAAKWTADGSHRGENHPLSPPASVVSLPFPPVRPVGVLAVLWHQPRTPAQLAKDAVLLRYLADLTGAALGNVNARLILTEEVETRSADAQVTAAHHAREIDRRDTLAREMDRIAVTDVLTGMLNRRGFFVHAGQSFNRARREGRRGAVIFVDIDGLKAINDSLGHETGDCLIQAAAQILTDSFRESDVVGRLGGDEFAVFTLNADPEAILERLQANVRDFHRHVSTPYLVSFSTGVVLCDPDSDLTLPDYLALADQQMYRNKRRLQ